MNMPKTDVDPESLHPMISYLLMRVCLSLADVMPSNG